MVQVDDVIGHGTGCVCWNISHITNYLCQHCKILVISDASSILISITNHTGWIHDYERPRTFKFSDPFTKPYAALFTVKSGNPTGFSWKDLTGRTIGLIDGFAYNQHCIAREAATIKVIF